MHTTATRTAAEAQTFRDTEKLLRKLAWDFSRKHGGDPDDHFSAAQEAFLRAYRTHDAGRGAAFGTHLRTVVWRQLITERRLRANRELPFSQLPSPRNSCDGPEDFDPPAPEAKGFDLAGWLASLSEDARAVAQLVLDAPADLRHALLERGRGDGPKATRAALGQVCRQIGWTAARIYESFHEIRRALRG